MIEDSSTNTSVHKEAFARAKFLQELETWEMENNVFVSQPEVAKRKISRKQSSTRIRSINEQDTLRTDEHKLKELIRRHAYLAIAEYRVGGSGRER